MHAAALWEKVRNPRGRVTRMIRRAGLTAVGTYSAYLAHGLWNPRLLRSSVTRDERTARLPGDDLVQVADWVTEFGTDVADAPDAVWPWLIQMGYGRAGWYTWFPLDNGGVPSADRIVPDLQKVAVGDVIPDGPRAREGFGIWRVRQLEPNRALVLHSRRDVISGREVAVDAPVGTPFVDCSWAFVLVPSPVGTRLRLRVRARLHGRLAKPGVATAARILFGLGDNVMENSLLAGIKQRAERSRSAHG